MREVSNKRLKRTNLRLYLQIEGSFEKHGPL